MMDSNWHFQSALSGFCSVAVIHFLGCCGSQKSDSQLNFHLKPIQYLLLSYKLGVKQEAKYSHSGILYNYQLHKPKKVILTQLFFSDIQVSTLWYAAYFEKIEIQTAKSLTFTKISWQSILLPWASSSFTSG